MKIGLVLSGGGMRGAAHIGAIKALEENNIFPNLVGSGFWENDDEIITNEIYTALDYFEQT